MGLMIRQIPETAKLADEDALEALEGALPKEMVASVVSDLGVAEARRRKLPAELTIRLTVAMNLFTQQSLGQVLVKMEKGFRLLWPDPTFPTANKSAICQARYRVGPRPVVALFHRVARPLATPSTRGAYLFGLRLMALDLTVEDVADSPENARAFGRHRTDRGQSAYPQVLCAYLEECGTHAIIDAGVYPCHANQHACAQRLLRTVSSGMLLSWDCGLHSFEIAKKTLAQDAHFLGRMPLSAKPKALCRLEDGSYLAYIYPADRGRRRAGEHLLVRIIEYTLTDPNRVGYGQVHRLMTSLLDPRVYPALALILGYHERWEIELAIDEIDTHQRLSRRPLRSKKPVGVVQELYGLLIAHYVVRKAIHDAAIKHDLDPDRLSFTNALELVRDAVHDFQLIAPEAHPRLYQRLLDDIAHYQLPPRANRLNPRVVKRKIAKFNLKRPEHQHWPQPTKPFPDAVAVLI